MKLKSLLISMWVVYVVFDHVVVEAQTLPGTALMYQGQIKQNGKPVNDSCDFEFTLWNDAVATDSVNLTAGPLVFSGKNAIAVTNGLFSAKLEFGSPLFGEESRWLEIAVRCPSGSDIYTTLSPRQEITPAPYALALPGLRTQPDPIAPNVIGGSKNNFIADQIVGSSIGGGMNNTIGGNLATIAGGDANLADGDNSFAAGHRAKARHKGTFIWADSGDLDFESTKDDQFLVRASGGTGIGTTDTTHQLTVAAPDDSNPENADNTLRLMGPDGNFNHGARLNFGDADWVYLDEDIDDGLVIHAARRIAFTGGNVGIGTTSPAGLLEVSGSVGNSSVIFPKDAIDDEEILNEPGVGNSIFSGDDNIGRCDVILDDTIQTLRSRSLEMPTSGFIMVIATAKLDVAHNNMISSEAIVGVSLTAGSLPAQQNMGVKIAAEAATGNYYHTVTVHGLFNVSAGPVIVFLLGRQLSGDIRVCDMQLTAIFFPTAYGNIEPNSSTTP